MEYEDVMEISSKRWVIAGGFASYLLGETNAFNDVDVFLFDPEFDFNELNWRFTNHFVNPINLGNLCSSSFDVFTSRKSKVQIITVNDFNPLSNNFLIDVFVFMDIMFDCHVVKKAIHIPSEYIVNINFGNQIFWMPYRKEKYAKRCVIKFNPPSMKYLAITKFVRENCTMVDFTKYALLSYFDNKYALLNFFVAISYEP